MNAAPLTPLGVLERRLRTLAASVDAEWGIYVRFLDGRGEIAIDADVKLDTMSLIKVPILVSGTHLLSLDLLGEFIDLRGLDQGDGEAALIPMVDQPPLRETNQGLAHGAQGDAVSGAKLLDFGLAKAVSGPFASDGVGGLLAPLDDDISAMLNSDGTLKWATRSFGPVERAIVSPSGVLYVATQGAIYAVK